MSTKTAKRINMTARNYLHLADALVLLPDTTFVSQHRRGYLVIHRVMRIESLNIYLNLIYTVKNTVVWVKFWGETNIEVLGFERITGKTTHFRVGINKFADAVKAHNEAAKEWRWKSA